MQDDIFVIDGVAHSFDMSDDNLAEPRYAGPLRALQASFFAAQPPGYDLDPEKTLQDWPVEDTANLMFRESRTDVAIFHPVPIFFFKDGLSGFHKAVEATKRWPNRFIGSYVAIDPLRRDPLGEMERQFEALDNPVGLKLYPVSYHEGEVTPWRMDDPKIAFPMYEKALELGITHVATHKSLPMGPSPSGGDAFSPVDVDGAAAAFPNINFSIVHGGMSFTEETAWLLARFPNVWVNLETLNIIVMLRPRVFGELLAGLLGVAGEAALDRIYWASGAMNSHPQPGLEAFMNFQFTEEQMERHGIFFPIPQLTHEHKRAILGGNIARLHGLDVDALAEGIKGDEFAMEPGAPLPTPYSTTSLAGAVQTPFPVRSSSDGAPGSPAPIPMGA
jgi:predicted TIM-barrel fold metal-dependent hydrolase